VNRISERCEISTDAGFVTCKPNKKISEWQAQEHNVDHKTLKQTFSEISQGKFPTAEKGKCKYGVNCKYKWKCKYTHPDDEERARRCRPVTSIATSFGEEGGSIYEGDARQNIVSAVQQGLRRSKKRTRAETEGDSLLDEEALDNTEENDPKEDNNKKAKTTTVESDTKSKHISKEKETPKKEVPKTYKPVKLTKYKKAAELEKLGLDHLKAELQRVGLKCGGNLQQRAERLFLLKTKKIDELPKKTSCEAQSKINGT